MKPFRGAVSRFSSQAPWALKMRLRLHSSTGGRDAQTRVGGTPILLRDTKGKETSGQSDANLQACCDSVVGRATPGPLAGAELPMDYGPVRETGLWKVQDVMDASTTTVNFRHIDDVESEIVERLCQPDDALIVYDEEERWKHTLMFVHKFKKTPKHLTWRQLGEEINCVDCNIDMDRHRPEELYTVSFYFTDKKSGTRDIVWSARNDVSHSEGFTDLLAAIGACLGRADVHRTIRFDDGVGTTRDITIRKRSRYTSDITVAFRPPETYNAYLRKHEQDEYEKGVAGEEMNSWGFHPALMEREYSDIDFEDAPGTYTIALSAHSFSFIVLQCINRLLARPMRDFYRPSQLIRTTRMRQRDEVGVLSAMRGWLGIDEKVYPHYTPIEAIQEHWLGRDAPFTLVAVVNKLREMTYLKRQNAEFQSWLSVRHRETHIALRNVALKLLGVGASTLFLPVSYSATVNRLLPKSQQRRLECHFSLNAVFGLPDETRRLDEFKKLSGEQHRVEIDSSDETHSSGTATVKKR